MSCPTTGTGPTGPVRPQVYAYNAQAGYDDAPQQWLSSYESVLAQFGLNACYGNMEIAEGRAFGLSYGYKPDGTSWSLRTSTATARA